MSASQPSSDPAVAQWMDSVEARLAALERAPSGANEAVVPTFLTLNPATGAIGALFSGGLELLEQPIATFNATEGIGFIDPITTAILETIFAFVSAGVHWLVLGSNPDALDQAAISMGAQPGGGGGSASINLTAKDALNSASRLLLDSLGRSAFLQSPTVGVLSTVGTATFTWPGGVEHTTQNVKLSGASSVCYGVALPWGNLSDAGGGCYITYGTPDGAGGVTFQAIAVTGTSFGTRAPANGVTAGFTYLIWGA